MKELKRIEDLLNSQDKTQVEESIRSLVEIKNYTVTIMLNALLATNDNRIRKEIALSIVDNFKDDKIITALKELIVDKRLENENAILVYALGEYSNSIELLDFLVELVLNLEYHAALNAINVIFSMVPQFDEISVISLLNKVESTDVIEHDKQQLIADLKSFLKNVVP